MADQSRVKCLNQLHAPGVAICRCHLAVKALGGRLAAIKVAREIHPAAGGSLLQKRYAAVKEQDDDEGEE